MRSTFHNLRFPGDRITECVFGNHHAGIIIPENVKILNGFYSYSGKGIKEDVGTRKTTVSPKTESVKNQDVEKAFTDWEIDEEIAQMKSEMHSSGFKSSQKNNQKSNTRKSKNNTNQLINAYNTLGLKPDASPSQIKQAYNPHSAPQLSQKGFY